ncbi:hypothetical protein Esti_002980 [Eimeria stiedai]
MAWRSHGSTNAELVENLRRNGVFKDQRVYETMLKVDRGFFVSTEPYADSPQPIGFDATISAPHMHAVALEQMAEKLVFGNRALDVGSGTGYLTVCMALMVGADKDGGGVAVGIDYKLGLVDLSRRQADSCNWFEVVLVCRDRNVHASFPDLLKRPSFQLVVGNGWAGGPSVGAPYDAIHVGAAAQAVPAALLQQLAPGGLMVIPVESRKGKISIEGEGDRELPGEPFGWGQVLVALRKHADGKVDVKRLNGSKRQQLLLHTNTCVQLTYDRRTAREPSPSLFLLSRGTAHASSASNSSVGPLGGPTSMGAPQIERGPHS